MVVLTQLFWFLAEVGRLATSRRQDEFLAALTELCATAGGPVHYADVATRMGVSKWTSYDMLRRLCDSGRVTVSHAAGTGNTPGRRQVLFAPAQPPSELSAELADVRAHYVKLRKNAHISSAAVAEVLWAELRSSPSPLWFCAGLLLLFVVYLEWVGVSELAAAKLVLTLTAKVSLTLVLFLGFAMKTLSAAGILRERLSALAAMVERFSDELSRLDEACRIGLCNLLGEYLAG
jgi:hypothetical protein